VLQYERIVRARLENVIPSPYRPIGPSCTSEFKKPRTLETQAALRAGR